MEQVYLNRGDFCRGIVLGLVSQGITQINLLSDAGHYAAQKTLTYLRQQDNGQFDYRFRIVRSTYRVSGDWTNAVRDNYVSDLLHRRSDGLHTIMVKSYELDRWFRSQPGSRQLWEDCAKRFHEAYREYLPPR